MPRTGRNTGAGILALIGAIIIVKYQLDDSSVGTYLLAIALVLGGCALLAYIDATFLGG